MALDLRYIFLSGIVLALSFSAFNTRAQVRCGTVEYTKTLHPNDALHKIQFERWLGERALPQKKSRQSREEAGPYQIPVVVHIIHNGEPIGTGANISEAQVLSQIRVLNEDFNRQNGDAGNTPPVFAGLAGSMNIEFVLAQQTPEGQATSGVERVNGGKSSWTMNDNYALKDLSYWPAEQYMNIWVCNLTDSFVGYAQFPESDLVGLENSSTNRLTDGIVIWYRAFGSSDDGMFNLDPTFNKGRTVTHEAGHFFGLRHIWGDDNSCSGSDYVTDTPNQAANTDGCPSHPRTDACGEVVMFQNFLDYTDDQCMNLFTQGQINRMVAVIENGPRRSSLLTSPGLLEPDPLPNDLGIRRIVQPDASVCGNLISPVLELRNYGSNLITSTRIRFVLDGTTIETKDFAVNLNPFATVEVSFTTLSISSGSHDISFQILLTNGGTDSGSYNDNKVSTVIVPAFAALPIAENFTAQPAGWIIHNPDGQITWDIVTAPNEMAANKALKLNYFDYEDKIGEIDIYLSPLMDLSTAEAATLTFDVAHARYAAHNDRLRVIALTNCQDIYQGTVLYDKAGEALRTAPGTTSSFTPSSQNQWRKELIDLSDFIGTDKMQIAFVGINDWGNNIYLDNITLFTEATTDVSLVKLVTPSPVACENQITPKILIQNAGSVLLTTMDVEYRVNGGPVQTVPISGIGLPFGEQKEIELPLTELADGTNSLTITLKNPNGGIDENTENNALQFTIVINKSADRIPLRENFDADFTPEWTVVNPSGGMNWESIQTNFNGSLYFNAFNNDVAGDEAWLVSPVLDFSRTNQATLLFDLSHANRVGGTQTLSIFASTDCGVTYNAINYYVPPAQTVIEESFPDGTEDWHRNISVNLNSLAGKENVRIAFVVRNTKGNNLFLDNIEFFITADPDPIEIETVYSIYGYDLTDPENSELKITFNLPERQDVRYSVISVTGQLETDGILADVLNQTYPLSLSERLPPGVYFVRVLIGGRFYTSRVLVH